MRGAEEILFHYSADALRKCQLPATSEDPARKAGRLPHSVNLFLQWPGWARRDIRI